MKSINNTIPLYWAASAHDREVGGVDGCLEFELELLVRVRVRVGLGLLYMPTIPGVRVSSTYKRDMQYH